MNEDQILKFIQPTTGQVYYLEPDGAGGWTILAFRGGPEPLECLGAWPTKAAAEEAMTTAGICSWAEFEKRDSAVD